MASVTRNPRPLFVTTLPAGYDGQEVFFQSTTAGTGGGASNSMADVGAVYHLRYRSAASSSYKWEVVGAPPIGHYNVGGRLYTTVETTTSGTFVELTTRGPLVTVPLAGDYNVSFSAVANNSGGAGAGPAIRVFKTGDTAGTWQTNDALYYPATVGAYASMSATTVRTGCSAADVIELYYAVTTVGAAFYNRSMTVTPIRVG